MSVPSLGDPSGKITRSLLNRTLTSFAMCKHILNAQVSVRAPCCKKWFDCPECHAEVSDHKLSKTLEMHFICKKCRKAFRKDMTSYEESDEYCPNCDNHYVINAKTPKQVVGLEAEDIRIDNRIIRDEREGRKMREIDLSELLD